MKISQSFEDYLESIYILEISGQKIKSVSVAKMLNVTKAAVSKAMKELLDANYIAKTPYSELELTENGRNIAKTIYHRHVVLRNFLVEKLGVSKEVAEIDCCKIEHIISEETFKAIEKLK